MSSQEDYSDFELEPENGEMIELRGMGIDSWNSKKK